MRDRRHHGHVSRAAERLEERSVDRRHAPHLFESGIEDLGGHEAIVDAREPERRDAVIHERGRELGVHLAPQTLDHGPGRRGVGHPQPPDPARLEAEGLHQTAHLCAAAVDDDHLRARLAGRRHGRREARARPGVVEDGAPDLHDDPAAHASPHVSSSPRATFMFCTACPAAPFTRLSMAEVTTTWPKASAAVTWQWFVPMTSWVRG